MDWPKNITTWIEGRTGYMSIPFTWLLPKARRALVQRSLLVDRWIVGGPAARLMPDYLDGLAEIGGDMPGVLQRVNPMATRTTTGCPNRCGFCGIGRRLIEGDFTELDDWPDLPIVCDNNLMAASDKHFNRVIARLVQWGWCDFNQGLDARRMTAERARRIAEIRKPIVRLALDSDGERQSWERAVRELVGAGIAKMRIKTYVLVGWTGNRLADWNRCEYVRSFGLKAFPMWFHELYTLRPNQVTARQWDMGWTESGRKKIMGYYYRHRGHVPMHVSGDGAGEGE